MFTSFDYLAEFVVVAETGSISEAASVLSLSQPTISKHLGALESELSQPLLVRTPHGSELTPVGVAVLEAGKRLREVGEEVERAVRRPARWVCCSSSTRWDCSEGSFAR